MARSVCELSSSSMENSSETSPEEDCVSLWDGFREGRREGLYPIWKTMVLWGARGIREPPNQVGMLITTWSLGG